MFFLFYSLIRFFACWLAYTDIPASLITYSLIYLLYNIDAKQPRILEHKLGTSEREVVNRQIKSDELQNQTHCLSKYGFMQRILFCQISPVSVTTTIGAIAVNSFRESDHLHVISVIESMYASVIGSYKK